MEAEKPPEPPSSPPQIPLGSCWSYQWTSSIANESSRNFSSLAPDTMITSQENLGKGDLWQVEEPRGTTLDLEGAFDRFALEPMSPRTRSMSVPALKTNAIEEDEFKTVFREDSSFESGGISMSISTESDEPLTVKIRREPERAPLRPMGDGDSNQVFQKAAYVDVPSMKTTPIQNTPKRSPFGNTRFTIPNTLNIDKLIEGEEHKENLKNSLPKMGRRGTQAIVFKSSPIQGPSPAPNTKISNVRSIASGFEEKSMNRQFGRKINAQEEIAELRRLDESQNSKKSQYLDASECFENSKSNDFADGALKRKLSSQSQKQRSGIQMGITVKQYKIPKTSEEPKTPEAPGYPPTRGGPSHKTYTPSPTSHHHHLRQKSLAGPLSDVPTEVACDQIDEMFDFGQNSSEIDNFSSAKTLDRTIFDGFSEVVESPKPGDRNVQDEEIPHFATPQFTRSSTLVTPHAGLPVTEYRVSDREGLSAQKIVVHKSPHPPTALATSTPKGTVTRSVFRVPNSDSSFVSSISNFSSFDRSNDCRKQIIKLTESMEKTRRHVQLAELSLLEAKKARSVVQELASQRVLLIGRERLKLQMDEKQRLQALAVVRHPPPPINRHFKSTMVISKIALQLNKNFQARGSFAFIVLFKCRTEVEASGVVTLLAHYQARVHVIQFGEHIHFSNLPVDFVIGMEVYMMRVPEYKPPERTCAAYLAEKVRNLLVPKRIHRRQTPPTTTVSLSHLQTAHHLQNLQYSPECEFKFCGKLTLDRDSSGDRNFLLDDVTYPLEGTVRLHSACSSLPGAIDVEYRGFLFLFQKDNSGSPIPKAATWHRYWALLHRGIIFFWNNPIDEKNEKIPVAQIDLTKCTNRSIEETRSKSTAQHEFHIELLVDQAPTLLEKRRVLLAAESADHMVSWLTAINDTLYILRS